MTDASQKPEVIRLCLAGTPACAGLSPCEACRTALAQYVIPSALRAAGLAETEAVVAFVDGYNAARRLLLQEIARAQEARRTKPTEPLAKPTEPSVPEAPLVEVLPAEPKPKPAAARAPRREAMAKKTKPAPAPAVATHPENGASGDHAPAPIPVNVEEKIEP